MTQSERVQGSHFPQSPVSQVPLQPSCRVSGYVSLWCMENFVPNKPGRIFRHHILQGEEEDPRGSCTTWIQGWKKKKKQLRIQFDKVIVSLEHMQNCQFGLCYSYSSIPGVLFSMHLLLWVSRSPHLDGSSIWCKILHHIPLASLALQFHRLKQQ